jgi:hypothetical protein
LAVFGSFIHGAEVLAAVVGDLHANIDDVDAVEGVRACFQLLIVVRARSAGDGIRAFLPACTTVGRTPGAAFAVVELDHRIDHIGILGRDRETDFAEVAFGQSTAELGPGFAAIGGLVDSRLGTTVDDRSHGPVVLPGRGVENFRITGVHDHVGDAGPLAVGKDVFPGLAAVGRLEKPALATGRPQRALRCRVYRIRVGRIDDDLRDVLRFPEAHVLPAAAAVEAAVNTVSKADVAAADVLAGAHPDDLRVGRIENYTTDGVRLFSIKDRLPRRSRIDCLPDTAGPHRHVPGAEVGWVDGDVGDAPGHQSRTDASELEAGQRL